MENGRKSVPVDEFEQFFQDEEQASSALDLKLLLFLRSCGSCG